MTRTERGRVVYDRKEHPFSVADSRRIQIAVADIADLEPMMLANQAAFEEFLATQGLEKDGWFDWVDLTIDPIREILMTNKFQFGGGSFGGGGASRSITGEWLSDSEQVIQYAVAKLRHIADTIEGIGGAYGG